MSKRYIWYFTNFSKKHTLEISFGVVTKTEYKLKSSDLAIRLSRLSLTQSSTANIACQ